MKNQSPLKNIICFFIILFGFSMMPQKVSATHVIGSELSYVCTDTAGVYKITLKVYRDCSSEQLCSSCPVNLNANCSQQVTIFGSLAPFAGTNLGSITLYVDTMAGVMDMVQLCELSKSTCTNCGARTAGTFSPGMEVYTFKGIADLRSLPNACCEVKIGYSNNFRNTSINTLVNPGTINYYNDLTINTCLSPCNSSPVFTLPPTIVVCAGQDLIYSFVTTDPDGDSLSYHLGSVLSGVNQAAVYANPYTKTAPFSYLGAPIQSPPALPPVGINLDPVTGDFRVRPWFNFVSNLVVEINQWKMIGSNYQFVGQTRRDIEIISVTCPANTPPVIKTYNANKILTYPQPQYNQVVNATQQLCFTVVAWENAVIDDTTDLEIIIPTAMVQTGATATPMYNKSTRSVNGPKYDSILFCWTPPVSMARTIPYYLTVKASDRICPIPGKMSHTVGIKVNGGSVGLKKVEASKPFTIYPNPAKSLLNIQLEKAWNEKILIEIFSVDGKLVQSQWMNQLETQTSIKTDAMPAGMYFIRLNGINIQYSQRFAVE
ncbi:MAG: T9SS type A sorting domain-containing protein [Bacteroidota bacterium]|nr:T9SS type A sorting domain-containing protein [Bacteroidota bacterium]